MYRHITVVPSDHLVIIDGKPLQFSFPAPNTLHALQWHEGAGHLEYTDGSPNRPLVLADYAGEVAPYAALWEAEKARLDQDAAAAEAARLAGYNSPEARADRVRAERDRRISATDYLLTPDYPLSEASRAAVSAYRQALRDLPAQPGFPWLGGGEDDPSCPWPEMPVLSLSTKSAAHA